MFKLEKNSGKKSVKKILSLFLLPKADEYIAFLMLKLLFIYNPHINE
jgi:hypothetical protein